jgi:hypothetical protein
MEVNSGDESVHFVQKNKAKNDPSFTGHIGSDEIYYLSAVI